MQKCDMNYEAYDYLLASVNRELSSLLFGYFLLFKLNYYKTGHGYFQVGAPKDKKASYLH